MGFSPPASCTLNVMLNLFSMTIGDYPMRRTKKGREAEATRPSFAVAFSESSGVAA